MSQYLINGKDFSIQQEHYVEALQVLDTVLDAEGRRTNRPGLSFLEQGGDRRVVRGPGLFLHPLTRPSTSLR